MSESTAVATVEQPAQPYALRSPIAKILNADAARALIEPMLRPGDSYERIVVEVYHAVAKNPDILKCTPQSIVNAVSRAVRSGLVISEGVHLVPYGATLTEIYDYKGRIQLIVTAGSARSIDAQCVYENDRFEYEQGTSPRISHSPVLNPAKRGPMVGAYAIANLGRAGFKAVVLSTDEIEKVRQTYSKQHKKGELPYWYAQKTCVHRLAKLLPKNPELAKVVAMFEAEDAALEQAAIGGDVALDTTRQLGAGVSGAESSVDAEARSQSQEESMASATPASIDERAPLDEPKPLTGPAVYPMPFTWEGYDIKTPLGLVQSEPLGRAIAWAKNSRAANRYIEFIQAGEMVLDDRKNGDADEPKALTGELAL